VTAAADATRAGAGDAAGSCESGTSTAGCQGGTGGVVGGGGGGQPARARSVGGGATVVVVEVGAAVLSAGRRSATGGAAAGLRPDRGVDCRDEAEANTETRTRTAVAAVTASADRSGSLRARRRAADSAPGCGGVPTFYVQDVRLGPQCCSFGSFVFQLLRNSDGGIGEAERPWHIHPDLLPHFFSEFRHYIGVEKSAVPGEKLISAGIAGQACQLVQQLLPIGLASGRSHRKPLSSSCSRIFFRQRPRMKPIDPEAMPSSLATS